MILGSKESKLDEQGRLKLPATFKPFIEEFGKDVYITKFDEPCLRIYPRKQWENKIQMLYDAGVEYEPKVKRFLRQATCGSADRFDDQERILIPPELRRKVQINGVVIVKAGFPDGHLEVWDPGLHDRLENDQAVSDEDMRYISEIWKEREGNGGSAPPSPVGGSL